MLYRVTLYLYVISSSHLHRHALLLALLQFDLEMNRQINLVSATVSHLIQQKRPNLNEYECTYFMADFMTIHQLQVKIKISAKILVIIKTVHFAKMSNLHVNTTEKSSMFLHRCTETTDSKSPDHKWREITTGG